MAEEYPSAAFIITIIGAIFALFGWLIISIAGVMISSYPESSVSWFGVVCAIVGIIGSVLGFLAAFWMRNPEKVHSGGVLAIIAAVITIWSIIAFILLLIGGILALTWKKPQEKSVILPPPPPS
ncbi:DUF4064 domain-containing protein [Candidatus Aciduliprofundum boonei]|uniref:Uncharacterized protein n=1 Tax=Aciduliprofundum boonei (strain DSM 19572 / T469) TaxID=439481 RepID=B5IAA3_ACIB4|nr:DUF4064 domain-containing protein [Candidatus Aciduliprofundum boonei]ADD08258.1 conserved hypothetical protein [Aciduliprofundum boonei T469]EDY36972.1 hypothetical protein ABOONEI_1893 [Aciduliprofundum boonei T469]HII55044.1 DUF4064 domain-containing protein [Candidatus Aciduliprofundum boonei]